jgi:hypothetical protein
MKIFFLLFINVVCSQITIDFRTSLPACKSFFHIIYVESSGVLLERTLLGANMHYDEPVYSQALLYDGSIDPVINIEVQFYSKKNTSYYIFSRYVNLNRLNSSLEHRYLKRAPEPVCFIDRILHYLASDVRWLLPRI